MSSRTQQLRQSFLLMGAVVALVLVAGFALFSSRSVTRIVERQANERGQDMATHVASLVGMYLPERRREAEALAPSPRATRATAPAPQLPDDGPHEEEALPELLGAAGHVEGRERSYAGLPGGASLFIFMHL